MIASHIFASCPHLSIKDLWDIKKQFHSFESALYALKSHTTTQFQWKADKSSKVHEFINNFDAEGTMHRLNKQGIQCITYEDVQFPEYLRQIHLPPIALYIQGNIDCMSGKIPLVALVGPRKASEYGLSMTELFSSVLIDHGVVIVSGLAKGIDACAHKQSVEKNAPTIAVLAGSLESIYPAENTQLSKRIIRNGGVLISESGPGKPIKEYSFILRNRIISGLSHAVLLIEAGKKSGGLITAKSAFDQNRPVFTLPQSINQKNSYGSNKLIEDHIAQAIQSPKAILDTLGITLNKRASSHKGYSIAEKSILECINTNAKTLHELYEETHYSMQEISIIVSILEVQGAITKRGNKYTQSIQDIYQQLLL